ncbi:MAG TPA: hypothetical protein VFG87_25145 [Amycolatopsis sp.]|nr:hypothetical protein [Amycolatopsis sp.]
MRNDWVFDLRQAEMAYRTEELYRARRGARRGARREGVRWWKRRRRSAEVQIPEQRRPAHDRSPWSGQVR